MTASIISTASVLWYVASVVSAQPNSHFAVDIRCLQPLRMHQCASGNVYHYHYDREVNKCKQERFPDCAPNFNRFANFKECRSTCELNTTRTSELETKYGQGSTVTPYDACSGPAYFVPAPVTTPCEFPYSHVYKYEPHTQNCHKMVIEACGRVYNAFKTANHCVKHCHAMQTIEED